MTMTTNPALLPLADRARHNRSDDVRKAVIRYKATRTAYRNTPTTANRHWLNHAENTLVNAARNAASLWNSYLDAKEK